MNALTVLARIRSGQEDALRELLAAIGSAPGGNPYIHFDEDLNTHSARWSVVHDPENGYRLLLATEFDGVLEEYVTLLADTTPGLDDIWGKCEGYTGREHFFEFIRLNSYETQAFYIAYRDETVASIRTKISVRERLEDLLDTPSPWLRPLLAMISGAPQTAGIIDRICGLWTSARLAFHNWWANLFLAILKPLTQIGETKDYSRVSTVCGPGQKLRVQAPTAALAGQMITITDVKPGLFRFIWLRAALALNEFLAKYAFPPGLFAYVGTLWSFRWVLIDNNKRLIFLSVFDGTWQNYMGDFIDKIIWALDGIYNNTKNYPPGGMSEIDAFKAFILTYQFEPQILYKAYPKESVMNLIRDRTINAALADGLARRMGIHTAEVETLLKAG